MSDDDLAKRMNALLKEIEDGREVFDQAAADCAEPRLKEELSECADDCTRALNGLQKNAQSLGLGPTRHGSAGGALRQGLKKLHTAVTGSETPAMLDEALREAGRMESAFAAVLDADLPAAVRAVVEEERERVLRHPRRLSGAQPR